MVALKKAKGKKKDRGSTEISKRHISQEQLLEGTQSGEIIVDQSDQGISNQHVFTDGKASYTNIISNSQERKQHLQEVKKSSMQSSPSKQESIGSKT